MKLFALLKALAPLLALAISLGAQGANGQLAAYSETRSFRDALAGRSMEEALSGPVDKDTSSYGDRSAEPSGANGAGAPNGAASSTMMNIPANGNLNQQQQQMQAPGDEQQKGGELERESGPMAGAESPVDGRQQPMGATMRAKQVRMGARNGRLMRMMGGAKRSGRLQQQQQMNGADEQQLQSYGRQGGPSEAQTPVEEAAGKGGRLASKPMNGNGNGNGNSGEAYGQTSMAPAVNDEQEDRGYRAEEQRQQMSAKGDGQQSMAMADRAKAMRANQGYGNGNGGAMGAGGAAAQRAYGNGNGNGNGIGNGNGNGNGANSMAMKMAQASGMAQSMMMSLANKAAYMANQKAQMSQRQVAPPMMARDQQQQYGNGNGNGNGNGSARGNGNGNGIGAYAASEQQPQPQVQQANQMPAAMIMMTANGSGAAPARQMRRANQRKVERKMSPAMMNAMLNEMLTGRMANGGGQYGTAGAMRASAGPMAGAGSMARSPMGAEMLANMMLMGANGAAQMGPAKREQYKQMLMRAMMQPQQQQQQMAEGADEGAGDEQADQADQSPMAGANRYGERARAIASLATLMKQQNGATAASGYGRQSADSQSTPMGSMGSMGSMGAAPVYGSAMGMSMNAMDGNQNQILPAVNSYAGQMATPSAPGAYDSQQQKRTMMAMMMQKQKQRTLAQQQMLDSMAMDGPQREMGPGSATNYGAAGTKSNSASGTRSAPMAPNGGYGAPMGMQVAMEQPMNGKSAMRGAAMGQQREEPAGGAYSQQDMPMNGFSQAYNMEGQQDERPQQQREMGTKSAGAANGATKGARVGALSRPVTMSYGNNGSGDEGDQEDQQQQQQQQQDDGYGAAPMGMAEPFAFNYKTQDDYGNEQYRKEESDKNGVVRGSYGYMDQSGIFRHVEYVADENGFRANVKSNEPGLSSEQGPAPSSAPNSEAAQDSSRAPAASGDSMPVPGNGAGGMMPVAPPSSSSSLGGSSGMGDASLRLQQQPQQQQQDTQLQTTPSLADMAGMVQQANGNGRQQQQQQQQQLMSDNGSGIEK